MDNMKKYLIILLLCFYFLCYILPLGSASLFTPDETRYAEIPREVITGGDWIVPHLNGLRYFEKPVFGYWAHAVSQMIFGENNFAVRLPSAVSVGLSALLIFLLVRHISCNEKEKMGRTAALAALIFLSCLGVFGVGNIAVLDNLFSFFLTASIASFYFASEEQSGSIKENIFLILSGIACGLAFLTKGFLAFAIPVLTIAPYLIWEKRYRDLLRMSWLPILIALIVVLPWGILVHMREPDFWNFFFWNEHIRRFMKSNAQHKESFWFFFKAAPGMFLPWTFLIPAAVAGVKPVITGDSDRSRLIRFSLCWLVLPFLFFSASSGKLLTYILPCFPPFAILMFLGLINILNKERKNIFKWGVTGTGIFFGLILLALIYFQLAGFNDFRLFKHSWKAIMLANSLIVIILFCFLANKSIKATGKILMLGLSPFLFFIVIHYTIPNQSTASKIPGIVLERHRNISNDTIIISDESTIAAACWYMHRNDIYLLEGGGELNYGLTYPDASERLIDLNSVADFIQKNRGKIVLTGRVRNLKKWKEFLPAPDFQDDSGPKGYALWTY